MAEGLPPTRSPLRTIFVDTSIGTHLAVAVSIHDAIGDVKAKIKADHALCFQEVGEITITAIKVRRRRLFYSLADAMPVVNAFEGVIGSWFMCVDVAPMCFSKNNEVTNGKVMHDQLEHDDSAVRDRCH
ncbi:hypothetical protein HPP92_007644 [Vanilla planifolia]|uniref:Uncharacterized protein n=1 Tax=Vanilla planifolia TaxID=51239 RepID=A0A835VC15_VANPL|nr:hypothetical protein HPP92_007644 [Vanilla planifolia]